MTTRRGFLQSVPIVAATTVLPAKASEQHSAEYHLGKVAVALKALYGGEWKANIDHKAKMAVVIRTPS